MTGEFQPGPQPEPQVEHPDVIFCPDGPMLLRGDHVIEDEDGNAHRTTRPVSAVCRCGGSMIKPWCDGTHKLLRRSSRD
ncbi:CDGSH iron-sulfur domain-containing protein [Nesterenkonia sphaerica]|uniref:CDGSH iron-sulfur domain-containing protein n=1 Tax=Nesterenkonia sphaerica TaxID=1804988 RepID=A0A5R9APU1_9MICC|nr:CDGSH iron-sulfur domain-containing protein [Nesterenkonia sphaerica]TLP80034.1 CDGSH iron-sulfur domain-containing protein [Nesterenkonia sphaerica]